MDARDEDGLFFYAADHVIEVLVQEVRQDILLEVLVKIARLLDVYGEFRDDDGHEAVAKELAVVVLRDGGEVLGGRLSLLAVEGGEDLVEFQVFFGDHRYWCWDRGKHRDWNGHGSDDRLFAEVHVAGLDKLEAVEEEVDALGVVVANLAIEAVLADANTSALVVAVNSREDRLVVVVDDGVRVLPDVLGDVNLVDATCYCAE